MFSLWITLTHTSCCLITSQYSIQLSSLFDYIMTILEPNLNNLMIDLLYIGSTPEMFYLVGEILEQDSDREVPAAFTALTLKSLKSVLSLYEESLYAGQTGTPLAKWPKPYPDVSPTHNRDSSDPNGSSFSAYPSRHHCH